MAKEKNRSVLLIASCLVISLVFASGQMSRPAMGNQLGGFLKKKVKDAIKTEPEKSNEAADASSGGNSSSRFNDRVLELNGDALAKLEKALACEKEFRAEVDAKYAKMRTNEQYQKCAIDSMTSPEMQALTQNPGANAQAMQQMQTKMVVILEQKCGKNPNDSHKSDDLKPGAEKCSAAGGLTLDQYSIAKERITPFCSSGGQDKVKGNGNVYYVYTPAEVNAMNPKCARFTDLLK